MAINYPGPYELRIAYTTTPAGQPPLLHEQRLNLQLSSSPVPGTDFGNIDVLLRNGATTDLASQTDAWISLIDPLFATTTEFVLAELWKYVPDSFDASFVSAYELGDLGTSVAGTVTAGQSIMTFRTINGGIMRLSFMESVVAAGIFQSPPFSPAAFNTIADFVTGNLNFVYARDNSYPIARYRVNPGQSEALFKRRFRPN